MKPILGQIVFSLNVGNAARHCEQKLTPMKVTSVGNKYFKLRLLDDDSGWSECQYRNEDWSQKTERSADSCLYESEQDYLDEKEIYAICKKISDSFVYGRNLKGVSLEDLRLINKILTGE
jgi:Fe2+ transport system protein B